MFDSNAELNIRMKDQLGRMAADVLRLPLGGFISTPQTALLHRRGSAAIHFCNFCFPSARESAEGQRHAALFHIGPHNCTALLSGFSLLNSPSLLLCSEYGPCCFKNLSWIRLSLMELRGSVGSTKLGLKVVSAHIAPLCKRFLWLFLDRDD